MLQRLTDPAEIKLTLEGLYRDRARIAEEIKVGQTSPSNLKSVEEDITILEAQLRGKDAAAHHKHSSESDNPEHD